MPRNVETKQNRSVSDYFDETATKGLRAYFGNVVKGQSNIYELPFARGESMENILSEWEKTLVSIHDKWPSLYEYEIDLAEKVGPMSVMKPLKDRMDDIDAYYSGILLPQTPIDPRAIEATVSEWSAAGGLRMRSPEQTIANMKLSTNSGSPYFTRRNRVIPNTVPFTLGISGKHAFQFLSDWTGDACAILGWRGQEGGPNPSDVKQRVVWMFPFAFNIGELQVYQPLIVAAQKYNKLPAWVSMEAVDESITRLFDTKRENDLVVCTDFTKFDQHFNPMLQDAAQSILRSMFRDGENVEQWFRQIYPVKYMIPLMYNWDKVRYGKHGMASGSGGTNADESLAHRSLQYEAAILKGAKLNPNSQCLGDDGILSYPGITVEDVVRAYSSHGLEMNESKQYASNDHCMYLRRWHHKDYRDHGICVGVYPTTRALGRLRYMERFFSDGIWSERAVALRQLSILENVKYHPLKEEFVQFCMKRDRYRLGLDIPHFLDDIAKYAARMTDVMPDFLGYTRSEMESETSIADWWIVKYLKSLR